ncbi:helix-turn-helix transcriptional regulator [Streptomyces jumonjinensis]|uniref:helix-turn-helix transcriptional regulator n=1 Tax=Streptomyces jumonjinensis TaxID=1945 RepID=UPI0037B3CFFA
MALKRHRLTQRRQAVGYTQEKFAEKLGIDRSTVVRWESGRGAPQPWMRPHVARLLQLSLDELDALLSHAEQEPAPGQLRGFALRNPSGVDLATAASLRQDFDELVDRYDRVPSAGLLAEAGQHLSHAAFLADEARAGRAGRELRLLQADAATLMGQLVWDASQRHDLATARGYYDQAVEISRYVRDHAAEGHALLRTSYIALYGVKDARAGLDLVLRAEERAGAASDAVAGLSALHAAEAYAMLGQVEECERALVRAEFRLGRVDSMDSAAKLVSPSQFGRLAGSCYLALGQYSRAQRLLELSAAQSTDRKKSRAIVLGNLALAHLRQHDLDASVQVLDETITLLEETRGGGGLTLAFQVGREMRPWRKEALVQDVYDRLLGLMTLA